jgi:hypothetical protein
MSREDIVRILQSLQQLPQSQDDLKKWQQFFENLPRERQEDLLKKARSEYGDKELEDLVKNLANLGKLDPGAVPKFVEGLPGGMPGGGPKPPSHGPEPGGEFPPFTNKGSGQPKTGPNVKLPVPEHPNAPTTFPNASQAPFGGPKGPPVQPPGNDYLPKNRPDLEKLIGFWEANVGPLDDTPALKKAILDLANSAKLTPGKGGGVDLPSGDGGWLSFLEKQGSDAGGFGKLDWLDKSFEGGSWKLPELGLKDWAPNLSNSLPSIGAPSMPRPSLPSGGVDLPSGDLSLTPFLIVLAIAVAAYLVWRKWPALANLGGEKLDLSRGPWPVDPRSVNDRESLVRAFEFLSVLLCGDSARVWNHRTIAAALRARVAGADAVAEELAGLYEVARYTPATEPLPPDALPAARRCLCHLAGVNPA